MQRERGGESSCPTCKADLNTADVAGVSALAPLKTANPLAWRVLAKIQVHCPLREHGCKTISNFADIQSHLASETAHSGMEQQETDDGDEDTAAAAGGAAGGGGGGGGGVGGRVGAHGMAVGEEDEAAPAPPPGYAESMASGSSSAAAPPPVASMRGGPTKRATSGSGGGGGGGAANANRATALALKDQGNVKFSARQFKDAIALYTRAIKICPTLPALYVLAHAARARTRTPQMWAAHHTPHTQKWCWQRWQPHCLGGIAPFHFTIRPNDHGQGLGVASSTTSPRLPARPRTPAPLLTCVAHTPTPACLCVDRLRL